MREKSEIDIEARNLLNDLGGGPKPGQGAHPLEDDLWRTPIFKIHPLTQKLEAVGGLFFRFWPEHVSTLQSMKIDGWPHVEIISVSKKLWKRQEDEYARDEAVAEQHKQLIHQEETSDAYSMFNWDSGAPGAGEMPSPVPGGVAPEAQDVVGGSDPQSEGLALEAEGTPEMGAPLAPGGEAPLVGKSVKQEKTMSRRPSRSSRSIKAGNEVEKGQLGSRVKGISSGRGLNGDDSSNLGFSLCDRKKYQDLLENFRGRYYVRDGGNAGHVTRSIKTNGPRTQILDKAEFNAPRVMPSSRVMLKGDTTGGVRAEGPEERETKRKWTFTRKETGISNAPFTAVAARDEDLLDEDLSQQPEMSNQVPETRKQQK